MIGVYVLTVIAAGLGLCSVVLFAGESTSGGVTFLVLSASVAALACRYFWRNRVVPAGGFLAFFVERNMAATWGDKNPAIVCQQCQTRGQVRIKGVDRKKGISGGKATGAILTSGLSLLVTGLSRTEFLTQAHCENCSSTWDF